MKSAISFICVLLSVQTAFAQSEGESELQLEGETQSISEAPETSMTEQEKNWNLNIGMSSVEGTGNSENVAGKGIAIELQRQLTDMIFVGASFTQYNLTWKNSRSEDLFSDLPGTTMEAITASAEVRPVDVALGMRTKFFVAVNGGAMYTNVKNGDARTNGFYGAGLGLNYSNQVGLRLDMKSQQDFKESSTISAIGYF